MSKIPIHRTTRLDGVNNASAHVVSIIANIKDYATRSRLTEQWGEMSFEILEAMGCTPDPSRTREEHIEYNKQYARNWCEEIRTAILNQKRADDAQRN